MGERGAFDTRELLAYLVDGQLSRFDRQPGLVDLIGDCPGGWICRVWLGATGQGRCQTEQEDTGHREADEESSPEAASSMQVGCRFAGGGPCGIEPAVRLLALSCQRPGASSRTMKGPTLSPSSSSCQTSMGVGGGTIGLGYWGLLKEYASVRD